MHTVHPSPEAVRLAMSRIERAMAACGGDREAPMDWGIVHRHECRTTACHGGWYALGRLMTIPPFAGATTRPSTATPARR